MPPLAVEDISVVIQTASIVVTSTITLIERASAPTKLQARFLALPQKVPLATRTSFESHLSFSPFT